MAKGTTNDPESVNFETREYRNMKKKWPKIHDLKGGTDAMRAAGKRWLPKQEAESETAYKARLMLSVLYNCYQETVDEWVDKPFSVPVTVQGKLDREELANISADVDRAGKDLTAFGEELFEAGIDYGLTHFLVDYPQVVAGMTLQDKREKKMRPTFIHVPPTQLIGWKSEGSGAELKLTEIRIREYRVEPSGKYGETVTTYVRVYRPDSWEIWIADQDNAGGFKIDKQGTNPLGYIPLVTVYFKRTGFMTGEPVLDRMADLNIAHWQSDSDQRNILSFARFGLLFGKGFPAKTVKDGLTIGPKRVILEESLEADLRYVEHTGAAIQCGERDLQATETRMTAMGMKAFTASVAADSGGATKAQLGAGKTTCAVKKFVHKTATALEEGYRVASEWEQAALSGADTKLPDDFEVVIFDDFEIVMRSDVDLRILYDMRTAGDLSRKTMQLEAQRRGVLSDTFDPEAEQKQIDEEGPNLALIGPGAPAPKAKPKDASQPPENSGNAGGY